MTSGTRKPEKHETPPRTLQRLHALWRRSVSGVTTRWHRSVARLTSGWTRMDLTSRALSITAVTFTGLALAALVILGGGAIASLTSSGASTVAGSPTPTGSWTQYPRSHDRTQATWAHTLGPHEGSGENNGRHTPAHAQSGSHSSGVNRVAGVCPSAHQDGLTIYEMCRQGYIAPTLVMDNVTCDASPATGEFVITLHWTLSGGNFHTATLIVDGDVAGWTSTLTLSGVTPETLLGDGLLGYASIGPMNSRSGVIDRVTSAQSVGVPAGEKCTFPG